MIGFHSVALLITQLLFSLCKIFIYLNNINVAMFFRFNSWLLAQREILLCVKRSLKNLTILHQHVSFLIDFFFFLLKLYCLVSLSVCSGFG